ncbi:CD63 antigen [Agrilus planipennis]|uniref:Tetraspanin n=1 Tax=Agrilus planipennis TaxID=224129 RepID=A0A1W4XT51_AGRPL|nr:CD63 antigen [Agrilus planipennis]
METCGMSFIKYLLFFFNLIFAISGIGIIVAGAVVLADVGEFSHFMENRILAPPVVLIVVGAIIFIIAFLGCFGAIRESYYMLMAFAVCLLIVFIIELAVGIAAAVYKQDFEMALKENLKNSMKNYNSDSERLAWDNAQKKLSCCGVEGPRDWQSGIPASCCYAEQKGNEEPNNSCASYQKGVNYLSTEGCYEKLVTKARSRATLLVGVGIGIAFIQVIGIVLACWLATVVRREETKGA